MSTAYGGWTEDPSPWPEEARFAYAEVLTTDAKASGEPTEVVVIDCDLTREELYYNVVTYDRAQEGWVFPESSLSRTGRMDSNFVGTRKRAVLGEGTLVEIGRSDSLLQRGIGGLIGELGPMYTDNGTGLPKGHAVWVFNLNDSFMLEWGEFSVVVGNGIGN